MHRHLRFLPQLVFIVGVFCLGTPPALADGPFSFHAITPCRLVDTRVTATPLSHDTTRTFQVQGQCGVPSGAKAASINVTGVSPTHRGHLRIFPSGVPVPNVSVLNFAGGEPAVANGTIVPVATSSPDVAVYTFFLGNPPGANIHLILDVNGYFMP